MRRRSLVALALTAALALLLAPTAGAAVDGDLDNSFSGDGKLLTDYSSATGAMNANDAVVDSSGRLVVAGSNGLDIGVMRLMPDGSPDLTFGGDGDAVIDSGVSGSQDIPTSLAIDSVTGKILVAGWVNSGAGNLDLVVGRLLGDGSLDPSFDGPSGNGDGDFRLDFTTSDVPADIVPIGSGKAVLAASIGTDGTTGKARVIQLTDSGALDTSSFGSPNGYFDFQWTTGTQSYAFGLERQADGKLIVIGKPNATTTLGIARVLADGSGLDTAGFNSGGSPAGILRPAMPSGFIGAGAADVVIDSNGITVAGTIERDFAANFDNEPFLFRATAAGAVDNTFGTSNGFVVPAISPDGSDGFTSVASVGGKLFAGGFAGRPGFLYDQLLTRFTSAGALDSAFSGDGKLVVNPGATSVEGNAAPVSASGEVYLVGSSSSTFQIGVTAVCGTAPPACPGPETPDILSFSPASGSNENNPRVVGSVPTGPAVTEVRIYDDAACTEPASATGTEAEFGGAGIPVNVADNSTTTFHAQAIGVNGPSPCSSGKTYAEVTPPPQQQPTPPATTKKCKKGQKLKKGKCVKKKRKKKR